MTTRRPGALVAALVTALIIAGCNGGGDPIQTQTPTRTSSTTSTSPTETETVSAEEQAVLDAYQAFWDALAQANSDPPQSQVYLEPVATGAQLELANGSIKAKFLSGEETVGSPVLTPQVHSVEGDIAVIRDCQDTSGVRTRKVDGGEVLEIGRNPSSLETTLRLVDASWKVADTEYVEPPGVFCS